jgi:hypothetical protein
VIVLSIICAAGFRGYAQSPAPQPAAGSQSELAGEFSGFGMQVPLANYYFAKGAIIVFGTKWGSSPQTEEELEQRTWEDLVLSFEAFRRGIIVDDKDLDQEITKMLENEKVAFDRLKDQEAYALWVKEKTQEPVELFENQLRHLIQLQKLRQQIIDGITPIVGDEEAYQEFLNEHNTLELELAQFDHQREAQAFWAKIKKKPALWNKELTSNPKLFRKPGFVAFEFLAEMWKIPKDDLEKMLGLKVNDLYPPTLIYGGKYAAFRLVKKRLAEKDKFSEVKESYYKQIEMKKKYDGLAAFVDQLKADAKIVVYPRPQPPVKSAAPAPEPTAAQ